MSFAAVQLDIDLVPRVQVQHSAVAGVVVVLVRVLSDGTGSHLGGKEASMRGNNTKIETE